MLFGEEPGVGEGEAAYARRVRLQGVNCEAVELPVGCQVLAVEDDHLEPVWHRGRRLIVVRAEKGETGPAVVRVGRTAWRVIGELF